MRRALVIGLLVAACGGGTGSGSDDAGGSEADGGGTVDVCSLLTAEEAEQWLGSPVDSVAPSDGPGMEDSTCGFENSAEGNKILLIVLPERSFAEVGSLARGPETIEGLGEDAHADGDSVQFLQNGFAVSVAQISGPISQADLVEIGVVIAPRLP